MSMSCASRVGTLSNRLARTSRLPSPARSRSMSSSPNKSTPLYNFPLSPVPKDPLGNRKYIKTAAALIIGDEILNGKTKDTNSNYFARFCFEHGIDLKRIEVIPDNEEEIIAASRSMVGKYDFVVTTGGIGPTHDDITYSSLAKSFNQGLVYHDETISRMRTMMKSGQWFIGTANEEQEKAVKRMALFPEKAEILFVGSETFVPVVRLEGKLCIFPGIPRLFQVLLTGLVPYLPLPPQSERHTRLKVFTRRPEWLIAPYLTHLQNRVKAQGIQIGSYPVLHKTQGVCVSLIGRNASTVTEVANEVVGEVEGQVVSDEELEIAKMEPRTSTQKANL